MNDSMKTRMTLVVSLLVTGVVLVAAVVSLTYIEKHYKENISRYQFSVVTAMADSIDGKLGECSNSLILLASNLDPEKINDPSELKRFFSLHPYSVQLFDNGVYVLSAKGIMLGGSDLEQQLKGRDYSYREYYKKTVETGKPQISEPFRSSQKSGDPVVVFTTPLMDSGGRLRGVLCGSLDLFRGNFLGRLADVRLGEKGYLYLLNSSGTIIVHKERNRILTSDQTPGGGLLFERAPKGFEGTGETETSRGGKTLSTFKRLKNADWILLSNLPCGEAYAPIYRAKKYLLLLLTVVLLFSVFVVRYFMGRLTSPLISFSEKVKAMTEGGEPSPIEVGESVSEEISTLSNAFNSMIAEMEQRKHEGRARLDFLDVMLETMPNPVFFKDRDGKYIGCNRAFEEMLGVGRDELVGKTVYDLMPREAAAKHAAADERLLSGKKRHVYESQLELPDGAIHDLLFYKAVFPGNDGSPGGVVGTIIDISDRRRAEFELAEHAEFAVNLVQNSTVPTFVLDKNHCVIIWNRACEELTGVKAYRMIGNRDVGEVFYGHTRPVLADYIIDGNLHDLGSRYEDHNHSVLIPSGIHAERWFPELNGRERYVSFTAAPIENSSGELVAVIQTLEDITDYKMAMHRLKESEERMRAILDTAADGIITVGTDGIINTANPSCEAMFGYGSGSLTGRSVTTILPSFRIKEERLLDDRYSTESGSLTDRCEIDAIRGDGSVFPVELALSKLKLGGKLLFTCIITDIAERKRSQEEMQRTLSLLGATLESTADGILVVDMDEQIVSYNRKFLEMWQVPMDMVEKRGRYDAILSIVKEQLLEPNPFLDKTRELNSNPGSEGYDLLELIDGRIFERYSKPQRIGESIIGRVWSFRDVTEQRKLEIQLRHSQKMEALGTLAGGVAHDFNNMLTAIIGFSNLVQMNMENGDPKLLYIEQVLAAAERATGLTQSLLAYSRKEPINPGRFDLNEIVRKVVRLLSRLIGEDIELSIDLYSGELPIMADRGQIEQVLMNLATNARDAMPGKGELRILTDWVNLGAEVIRGHGHGVPGRYVHISISDSGEGMNKETLERIFEPFFTTKQMGRGTGLGLSIVYGIVKQHNGFITVSSEQGKGSCFDIHFPMSTSVLPLEEKVEEDAVIGGTETVLVVEDSTEIRYLLNQVLTGAGYRVIEAADGQEGVERFAEHSDDIKLLVLDVIMPRKNGRETYEEIRAMNDKVKAIFMSGYTAEIINREGIAGGEYNFLSKPLSPNAILKKVRLTLDA